MASLREAGAAVRIEFRTPAVPRLLPVAGTGVEVSCHLYHEPDDE